MQVSVNIIKSLIEGALDKKRDNHKNRNYEINSRHGNIYVWDIYDISSNHKYHIIEIKMAMGYHQPVNINFKNELENEKELIKMFHSVFKGHSEITFGTI